MLYLTLAGADPRVLERGSYVKMYEDSLYLIFYKISYKNKRIWSHGDQIISFHRIFKFFIKYPIKIKEFGLTETKLFHFHRIFKKRGLGRGFKRTP